MDFRTSFIAARQDRVARWLCRGHQHRHVSLAIYLCCGWFTAMCLWIIGMSIKGTRKGSWTIPPEIRELNRAAAQSWFDLAVGMFWATLVSSLLMLGIGTALTAHLIRKGRVARLDTCLHRQWHKLVSANTDRIRHSHIDMPSWGVIVRRHLEFGDAVLLMEWHQQQHDPHVDSVVATSIKTLLDEMLRRLLNSVIEIETARQSEQVIQRHVRNTLLADELQLPIPGKPPVQD